MQAIILTEKELRQHISIDHEMIETIAEGFAKLAQGEVTMPPIMRLDIKENNGEVDVKTAYVHGLDSFAIKMSPGFFDNHKLGLPSLSGMMVLLSAKTGFLQAVLLDNGYLTNIRTGAAGAVAAKYLAPETSGTAGVIGAGGQGRFQMFALKQVRDFKRLFVYDRIAESVEKYIEEMHPKLGLEIIQASSVEEVVRQSEIVVTSTPATDGYLKADWLHPGLHITAMGSDAEHKQELDVEVFARADVLVCDTRAQVFRLGEHHHAKDAGILTDESRVIELGEIVAGKKKGRTDAKQITVCDLTGTGMQDTVIARLAYEKALAAGLGTIIEN